MHEGASSSLCVRAKNRQILVRGKQYANRSQMVQHRFTVPSTHTRIWSTNRFASSLQTIWCACVYDALETPHSDVFFGKPSVSTTTQFCSPFGSDSDFQIAAPPSK